MPWYEPPFADEPHGASIVADITFVLTAAFLVLLRKNNWL